MGALNNEFGVIFVSDINTKKKCYVDYRGAVPERHIYPNINSKMICLVYYDDANILISSIAGNAH